MQQPLRAPTYIACATKHFSFHLTLNNQIARERYLAKASKHHNADGSKGEHCWLCGEPVDYRLRYPHPRSWTLDHAVPVKQDPSLMLNPSNFRSAHLECNYYRGSDEPPLDLGEPSEIW